MTSQEEWRRIEAQRAMGRAGIGTGSAVNARELDALHDARRLQDANEAWRRHDEAMARDGPFSDPPADFTRPPAPHREARPNIFAVIVPILPMAGLVWMLTENMLLTGGTAVALTVVSLMLRPALGPMNVLHLEVAAWLMGLLMIASLVLAAGYLFGGIQGLLIALAGLATLVALRWLGMVIEYAWQRFSMSRLGGFLIFMVQLTFWGAILGGIAYAWMALS